MIARHRLRAPTDISRVLRRGRSVAGPGFVLYHLPRGAREPSRFGFSVPRTVGGAVVRNRTRRLLREACRAMIPRICAPVDLVVVARPAAAQWELADLQHHLVDAAARSGILGPRQTKEGTST